MNLTLEQAEEFRRLFADGFNTAEIAQELRVPEFVLWNYKARTDPVVDLGSVLWRRGTFA